MGAIWSGRRASHRCSHGSAEMVWSQALEVCEGTTHMRLLGIEALLWGMDTHATASDVRHARTSDWADWVDGQKEIGVR